MKVSSLLFALSAVIPVAYADAVRYDTAYDNKAGSTLSVSCSDGVNGLYTKGYKTFGSLPSFPNIGAASAIAGWNSAACGSCWQLTYNGKSINVTAVDHAGEGFNLGLTAMNTLTNGNAVAWGVVQATAKQLPASSCGL
ncbi:Cerato-platanin [Artomyces pyxidatus]|uniref:Cerato-platanin n=1 Tax=Artomyces pyxidatus TaxID=48021 RepID=A0ACB8T1N1_9AGAM|nr:Cerato-platanin [Artomyces pyxidatus]